VIAPPNALVSIYRGTATNYAGDEVDADTPVATDVPMYVMETRRSGTNPAAGMSRVVRLGTGRCDPGVDVRKDDRVEDQRSGMIFLVEAVYTPVNQQHAADKQLDLKRTN
jgi:hypothetical protein